MGYIIVFIVGIITMLTVENTIILHRKSKKEAPAELTEEQKREQKRKKEEDERDAAEWNEVMNFHGRVKK